MDREIDFPSRPEIERASIAPEAAREPETPTLSRERQQLVGRNYAYCVSKAEMETMKDIGRFRTVDADDLVQFRYRGNGGQFREDLRSLQNQGLISRRTIWMGGQRDRLTVFVLTKKGKVLLEQPGRLTQQQRIYAGFVKPREVHHDAAIYRMYQAESSQIERAGGRIRRVVLDYELKAKVYRPLAQARAKMGDPKSAEYRRRQAEIAGQNQLKVVQGKILLPDLRIEYEAADGALTHVDLELATHHYRGSSLRAKAQAGFKMYGPNSSAGGTRPYDPEHLSEIFRF